MRKINSQLRVADIQEVREHSLHADTVIGVCQDSVEDNVSCNYSHYPLADGPHDTNRGKCTFGLFSDAVDDLIESLENGERVVVHCHAGKSRSVAVATAALAEYKDMPMDTAIEKIDNAGSYVRVSETLIGFIHQYVSSVEDGLREAIEERYRRSWEH